jgi:tetratricopeptide (TPR) repeat protein
LNLLARNLGIKVLLSKLMKNERQSFKIILISKIPLFLILSVFLSACGVSSEKREKLSQEDYEEIYQSGQEALNDGRYREAIGYFERASQIRPDEVELFYWLGFTYWNREEGDKAIHAYLRAVKGDPQEESDWSLYALENLAEVYTRTDHVKESKEAYLKALDRETRPEWILRIRNQLAELDVTVGIYKTDDKTVFNEKGEIIGGVGPDRMRTNRNFEIARHTNNPEKEAEYYRRSIDTDPGMYQPYFNLGLALSHLGKYREAIPWLEKSDNIWKADSLNNPDGIDKADAHAFLALSYLELGEIKRAKHHSERALRADDSYFWAILYDQRIKIAVGEAEKALYVLEGLMVDNPDHSETHYALSLAYQSLGRKDKARETLSEAIESIPENHPWMGRLKKDWKKMLADW